jgi:hypothetical protein
MSAGINTLINIMSRFGKKTETESNITHNERLEFLGDAVVEFLTSIHLFHMFPDLEEGGLATYRAAIVQNQHLAVLAKVRTRWNRVDWQTSITATELPLRVHLGVKLSGPLCAAIHFHPSSPESLYVKRR